MWLINFCDLTLTTIDLKNIHNLKVETYVLFGGNFQDFQAQEAASHVTLRELLRGGEVGS